MGKTNSIEIYRNSDQFEEHKSKTVLNIKAKKLRHHGISFMKSTIIIILLLTNLFAIIDLSYLENLRDTCLSKLDSYMELKDSFYNYLNTCADSYFNNHIATCSKAEWEAKYDKLKHSFDTTNNACLTYTQQLDAMEKEAENGVAQHCYDEDGREKRDSQCEHFENLESRLIDMQNDAYSNMLYSSGGEVVDILVGTDDKCGRNMAPCDKFFTDKPQVDVIVLYPKEGNIKRDIDGGLSINIRIKGKGISPCNIPARQCKK